MSIQYSPFPGPTPPYSNVPINANYYMPSRFVITDVTAGTTTTITTASPHNYVIGQLVRLLFPSTYGCSQLNGTEGYVIAIPTATEVTINIYSAHIDPFVASPVYGPTSPQIVAIGDIRSGLISFTGRSLPATAIPGSFVNISPQ
jgi:hypothetical protein